MNLVDRALRETENDAQKWLQILPCLASLFQPESAFHNYTSPLMVFFLARTHNYA